MPGGRDRGRERFMRRPQEMGVSSSFFCQPQIYMLQTLAHCPHGTSGTFQPLLFCAQDDSSHAEEALVSCIIVGVSVCLCVLEYVCDLCVFLCWPQCVCVSLCMRALVSVCAPSFKYISVSLNFLKNFWRAMRTAWNLSFPNQRLNLYFH